MNWTALVIFLIYNLYLLGIEYGTAVVGQRNMRKSWPQAYKWLVILCWVTGVLETVNFGIVLSKHDANGVYNVWAYFETGTLIYIQSCELTYKWSKRVLMTMLAILTVGAAANYIWGPSLEEFNANFQLFTLFVQLLASCAALIDVLLNTSDKPLSVQPAFWLAVGLLFYSSVFCIVHIAELFFFWEPKVFWAYMGFSAVANTFMYAGIFACFSTLRKNYSHV